jgi:phosphopantothenoylcysteine decarboxylase
MTNLLICFTGSVATIKDKDLVEKFLSKKKYKIKLLYTKKSELFSTILKSEKESYKNCEIILEEKEWEWRKMGDKVLHIYLSDWSDIILVAPLSCNTLAKITNGFGDNTITLVLRALKFVKRFKNGYLNWIYHDLLGYSQKTLKKVFVCPAMNTYMYEHPVTSSQIKVLLKWGFEIIYPIEKLLACNVKGLGAMEEIEKIFSKVHMSG